MYGGMPRVRTPSIKWDYTARRVLTMEWIEGVKLTNKPVRVNERVCMIKNCEHAIEWDCMPGADHKQACADDGALLV